MKLQLENADPPLATGFVDDQIHELPRVVAVCSFLFLPVIGLCFGLLVMLLTDRFIESRIPVGTSVRSHAMEGLFTTMPICLLLGAAIGVAVACIIVRLRLVAVGILCLASTLGWFVTSSAWSQYVATNGRDVSEELLYYPPIVLIAISCLLASLIVVLLVLGVLRSDETEFT